MTRAHTRARTTLIVLLTTARYTELSPTRFRDVWRWLTRLSHGSRLT